MRSGLHWRTTVAACRTFNKVGIEQLNAEVYCTPTSSGSTQLEAGRFASVVKTLPVTVPVEEADEIKPHFNQFRNFI